jgi:queuosine precursor transporter
MNMQKKTFVMSIFAFASIITLANFTVQIPINDWLTYGALCYPISFLLTDVLSEKYDKKEVLQIVKYGVLLAIIPTLYVADIRIALASIVTFFVIQQLDVHLFHLIKSKHPNQWWLRNNISTLTSQLFDTAMFYMLAFAFIMPPEAIIKLILGDYIIKMILALADTPAFYWIAIRTQTARFHKP